MSHSAFLCRLLRIQWPHTLARPTGKTALEGEGGGWTFCTAVSPVGSSAKRVSSACSTVRLSSGVSSRPCSKQKMQC